MSRDVWDAETYTTRTCTKMSSLNKITGNLDEMLSAFQIDFNAKSISQRNCKTIQYVKGKDKAFEKIRTSTDKRVWLKKKAQKIDSKERIP